MNGKDYINFKKVTLASFYDALSECAYNFIDNLECNDLSEFKQKDLMNSLANVFKDGTTENREFIKYNGRYVLSRLMEDMEKSLDDEWESEDDTYGD